jgi:predicted ABC-type ATPase
MPVMHLVAGPNGAGKTTFFERVLSPVTQLAFINADVMARQAWPGDEVNHGHEAAQLARQARDQAIAQRMSFVTETVFSHPSKLDLLEQAQAAGYLVELHVVMVPLALTLRRVQLRSEQGGHAVPPDKVAERYERLWALLAQAIRLADTATLYDNSSARTPFRRVARYESGRLLGEASWPGWSPLAALLQA